MVDVAFDDFLDSDDDEFFLEASNCLLDDSNLEYTATKNKNANEQVSENLPKGDTSNYFKSVLPSADKQDASDKTSSSNIYKRIDKNTNYATVLSLSSNHFGNNKSISVDDNDETVSNEIEISIISAVNKFQNAKKDGTVAATSSDCDISTVNVNSIKVATPGNSSYINNRFTPGFTPKAKKRKFLGPAGFLEFFDGSKEATPDNPDKLLSMDMEFQNIVSSQYTPEHLSLPSWQKLQATVSSCSNLHSTAKYYSIQRVLLESSKKKLPKHMVVPVLCVLLKKLSTKGSTVISVFMDDTGEINGKIDTDVLSKYKEFLIEGSALILKNVTFLCNLLILKDQNLVSLYHPEGTEKHPQSLQSVLETSEPLKPINCECSKLSHIKKGSLKTLYCDTPNHHTSVCVSNQNRLNTISYQSKAKNFTLQNKSISKNYKSSFINPIQNKTKFITNQSKSANKMVTNLISNQNPTISKASVDSRSMRSDEFLEQLLDEDNCMDEFDELLGNLDEKSFMEDA